MTSRCGSARAVNPPASRPRSPEQSGARFVTRDRRRRQQSISRGWEPYDHWVAATVVPSWPSPEAARSIHEEMPALVDTYNTRLMVFCVERGEETVGDVAISFFRLFVERLGWPAILTREGDWVVAAHQPGRGTREYAPRTVWFTDPWERLWETQRDS